jgi:serine/threonine protein kinase
VDELPGPARVIEDDNAERRSLVRENRDRQSHGPHLISVLCLTMGTPIPPVINGRYVILRPLGSGGGGSTFVVRDLYQGEEVALKLITFETGPWQEAQVLTALRDRHILPVRNADFVVGTKFLVTELALGGTIERKINDQGRCGIEVTQAVRWTRQCCEGLIRTHSANLLHNDVKPANVFIDDVGEALLGDFGMAMLMDPSGLAMPAGTVMTLAPEVAAQWTVPGARPTSVASDIYSLGGTLYWMLSGVPPYQPRPGLNLLQLTAEVATHRARPIRDLAPHVPQALAQRINVAMAFDPADRYQSAADFSRALGSLPRSSRQWTRTDECGAHWGCWRGTSSGRAPILVCAVPDGTAANRYELQAIKLPGRTQIRKAQRIVTERQLPAGLRTVLRLCN